jgi:peptidoglycan/xylan/chitin deacetylase (PgdA/CDA1 family)
MSRATSMAGDPGSRVRARIAALAVPRERVAGNAVVALTFDDGPDERFTPQVLDVLAEHGACATFFVVGRRAARHPELVRRIAAEGHGLGSHTWSHPELAGLPLARLLAECRRGRRAVETAVGRRVRAYRPPKGHFDPRGSLAARLTGLEPWLWSVDPSDWRPGLAPAEILAGVDTMASGDVVLLHDGIEQPVDPAARDRSAMVAALGPLLELAHERGLRTVTLDG